MARFTLGNVPLSNRPEEDHLLLMGKVVSAILTRLGDRTPRGLAKRLGCPEYGPGIKAWETGRTFPNFRYRQKLRGLIRENKWEDLESQLQQAEQAYDAKCNGINLADPIDSRGRQHGRETTLLEVLRLVESRVADMDARPEAYDQMYSGMKGVTTTEIVAHELRQLQGKIRALPITVSPRKRGKAGGGPA